MAGRSVPQVLEEIAMLLEIKGENPFKTRAYYNAAKALSGIEDLEEMIRERRLKKIEGSRVTSCLTAASIIPKTSWNSLILSLPQFIRILP
jgi:hypothetical protein